MSLLERPILFLFLFLFLQIRVLFSYSTPMNCTDTTRVCTSFLAFKPTKHQTLYVLQSMFDVLPGDITIEGNGYDDVFIKKNCSCASTNTYLSNTTFTMKSNDGFVHDVVVDAYDGLAFMPNSTRKAKFGAVVSLKLFCGCSSGLWNYLMSYVLKDGDSVESLASRFGVSMDNIEAVNGINNPDNVTVGEIYYIPWNSVPGEPYPIENDISPAPVPAPSVDDFSEEPVHHKASNVPYGWIIGSVGIGLALIILTVLVCLCFGKSRENRAKNPDGKIPYKFQILRNTSFCCGSRRYICCKSRDWKQTNGESSDHHINIPKGLVF